MSEVPQTITHGRKRRFILRWLGVSLITVALLLLFYGTIAYLGWQTGTAERQQIAQQERLAEMDKQMRLAQEDMAGGRYELALHRLDWLAAQGTADPQAAVLREEVIAQLALPPTPSPTATTAITPSPTPVASPTPATAGVDEKEAAVQYSELVALPRAAQNWAEVITAITTFQVQYPSYRRPDTDRMLYDAYVAYGLLLLPGDQIERGLFYLDQARRLGDLPEQIEGEVTFAELYLEGIVFYDVNWPAYLYSFRQLCAYAPLFHESCERLQDGLTKYGDQLAVQLDWCAAADIYAEAQQVQTTADETLPGKAEQAATECLLVTPTAPLTNTAPITNTIIITE